MINYKGRELYYLLLIDGYLEMLVWQKIVENTRDHKYKTIL